MGNGMRAVVERQDPRPSAKGRWEVEIHFDGGKAEIKSLKRENIATLNKLDKEGCREWAVAEKKFKEARAHLDQQIEDFKYSKCVDAKLAKMDIGPASVAELRKLRPADALDLLDNLPPGQVAVDAFLMNAVREKLDANAQSDGPAAKKAKT